MVYISALVILAGQMGWMEYTKQAFPDMVMCESYLSDEYNRGFLEGTLAQTFSTRGEYEFVVMECMTLEEKDLKNKELKKMQEFYDAV